MTLTEASGFAEACEMVDASSSAGPSEQGPTVYAFPGKSLLNREEAARYLGITPLRLRLLDIACCGPIALSPGRYRVDALDLYRSELFLKAALPVEEASRRALLAQTRIESGHFVSDPFMEMATQHDLRDVMAFIGGRVAIVGGLIIVVLSHTPLSRILTHTLR
ncbi:hypothetical protein [Acetobacter sp.]|uniref:hypothetical protein n=1 Tax=Acetobacter sp. TaxID=440 RepID=UPI0025C19E77|nr:hypothetical protein [Acetobacter sp.]MCH4091014.1 hypothetical protein [Acetobacter sp.]MCI1300197.1 hypothetical protein [Acetobacter sp.]MCI1316135.1 hypothetical protein [Acetobacter sp.]